MKITSVILLGLVLAMLCGTDALSQQTMITGGVQGGRLLDSGDGGDTFEFGPGGAFEFGLFSVSKNFCWVMYGVSWYKSTNTVHKSEADATFLVPYYTEFRWYGLQGWFRYFFFFGYDLSKMRFEGHDGYDTQHLLTTGFGTHLQLGKATFLQMKAKPYYVLSNDLGQHFGISLHFSLGALLGKS